MRVTARNPYILCIVQQKLNPMQVQGTAYCQNPVDPPPQTRSQHPSKKLRYDFHRHHRFTPHQPKLHDSGTQLDKFIKNYRSKSTAPQAVLQKYCEERDFEVPKMAQRHTLDIEKHSSVMDILAACSKELIKARPKTAFSPLDLPRNIRAVSEYIPRRMVSAREKKGEFRARLSQRELTREMKKELSLMSNLVQPCKIQKKVISSRLFTYHPNPQTIISSTEVLCKKPYLYGKARNKNTAKLNKQTFIKLNLSAWEGFKNESEQLFQ